MSHPRPTGAMGMMAGDWVIHDHTGRVGIAVEFFQDGDAEVEWLDGKPPYMVNWNNLSKLHPDRVKQLTGKALSLIRPTGPKIGKKEDNYGCRWNEARVGEIRSKLAMQQEQYCPYEVSQDIHDLLLIIENQGALIEELRKT